MTDKEKLEKVKAEIERLIDKHTTKEYIDEAADVLMVLDDFIDSLQKEPKECMYSKDNYTDEDRKALCDGCEEECKYNKKEAVNNKLGGINNALVQDIIITSKPIGVTADAIELVSIPDKKEPTIPDIVDEHYWEMLGKEPVSEDFEKIVEEIAEPTILSAYGSKELARRLRNTICGISVSEDLEVEIKMYLHEIYDRDTTVSDVARHFANWQKEKDIQYVKKECERTTSCCDNDIAIEATKRHPYYYASEMEAYANIGFKEGAMWQKEQDLTPSEDLGLFIDKLSKQFPEVSFAKLSRIAVRVAKWQKEQFEKNRLKHCDSITNEQAELEQGFIDHHLDKYNRMPTFLDAIEYGMSLKGKEMQSTIELAEDHAMLAGMEKMKEEMMAKAKGGTVQKDYQIIMDDGTYIDLDPSMSLKPSLAVKEGERIKVILIKEG